jgi:hypothetical protein
VWGSTYFRENVHHRLPPPTTFISYIDCLSFKREWQGQGEEREKEDFFRFLKAACSFTDKAFINPCENTGIV